MLLSSAILLLFPLNEWKTKLIDKEITDVNVCH